MMMIFIMKIQTIQILTLMIKHGWMNEWMDSFYPCHTIVE